jgi:thiol-disulfide isomerase/thioredoxin
MANLAKGLQSLMRGRGGLIAGAAVLVALIAAGPLVVRGTHLFTHNPLKPLAVGAMEKFAFKHAGAPEPNAVFTGPAGGMTLTRFHGKAILVNVWASWCAPCVKEMPSLDRLQAELGGPQFQVVAVNMDQDKNDALSFLADNKIRHLALYTDPNLQMSIALQAPGIPVSVLIDAAGKEVGRLVGPADWSSPQAKALIEAVIAPTKAEIKSQ